MELTVFTEQGCFGCERASSIANEIDRRFPELTVRVVDVGRTTQPLPEAVFAVPTYMLDDAVVSLGNPDLEDLAARLAAELATAENNL